MKRIYPYVGPSGQGPPAQPPSAQIAGPVDYSNYGYGTQGSNPRQPITAEEQQAQWHQQWQEYYAQQAAAAAATGPAVPPSAAPTGPQHQQKAGPQYLQQYPAQTRQGMAGGVLVQPGAYYQGEPYPQQSQPQSQPRPPHYGQSASYSAYPQQLQTHKPLFPQELHLMQQRPPGPHQPYPQPIGEPPPAKRPRFDGAAGVERGLSPKSHHAEQHSQPLQPMTLQAPSRTSYGWPGASNIVPMRPANQPPSGPQSSRGGRGGGPGFGGISVRPPSAGPQGMLGRGGARRGSGAPASLSSSSRGGLISGNIVHIAFPSRSGHYNAPPGGPSKGGMGNASNGRTSAGGNVAPSGRHTSGQANAARLGFSSQNCIPTGNKNRYNLNQQQQSLSGGLKIPSGPSAASIPAKPGQRNTTPTMSACSNARSSGTVYSSSVSDQPVLASSKRTFTDFCIVRIEIPELRWHWDLTEEQVQAEVVVAAAEAQDEVDALQGKSKRETEFQSTDDGGEDDDDGEREEGDYCAEEKGRPEDQEGEPEDRSKAEQEDKAQLLNVSEAERKKEQRQLAQQRLFKWQNGKAGASCRLRICFAALAVQAPADAPTGPSADRKAMQERQQQGQQQQKQEKQEKQTDATKKVIKKDESDAGEENAGIVTPLERSRQSRDTSQAESSHDVKPQQAQASAVVFENLLSVDEKPYVSEAVSELELHTEVAQPEIEGAVSAIEDSEMALTVANVPVISETGQEDGAFPGGYTEDRTSRVDDSQASGIEEANDAQPIGLGGPGDKGEQPAATGEDLEQVQTTENQTVKEIRIKSKKKLAEGSNEDGTTQPKNSSVAFSELKAETDAHVAQKAADKAADWSPFSVTPPQSALNRISITYAGKRRRLMIDADVIRSVRVHRGEGRIEIDVAVTTAEASQKAGIEGQKQWLACRGVVMESRQGEANHFTTLSVPDIRSLWAEEEEATCPVVTEGLEASSKLEQIKGEVDESLSTADNLREVNAGVEAKRSSEDGNNQQTLICNLQNDASAATVPPLHRLQQPTETSTVEQARVLTILVKLDKLAPPVEAKWLKTGDVEEWLAAVPEFAPLLSTQQIWHHKIQVVDPDPPPTMQDVFLEWSSKSFIGVGKDRRRFIADYLNTSRGQVEILCRLVRGERAAANVTSRDLASQGLPLSEAAKRTAFASHRTHLSLAVLALFGLAEEYATKSGATLASVLVESREATDTSVEGSRKRKRSRNRPASTAMSEFDTRIDELLMSIPQNLVFRALDSMWKEVLDKTQRDKQQSRSGNQNQRHRKTKGPAGRSSVNVARSKRDGSVASSVAGLSKAQDAQTQSSGQSRSMKRRRSTAGQKASKSYDLVGEADASEKSRYRDDVEA